MNFKKRQTHFKARELEQKLEFGGSLMTKARNRHARPISTKHSMHVVLKSSKAIGTTSFGYRATPIIIKALLDRHCAKYAVKLISYSNNFNHLHIHLKFASRAMYLKFIRSITAAIATAVTGAAKSRELKNLIGATKFFDYRPFTRVVTTWNAYKTLENYVRLNQLEAQAILPKRIGRLRAVDEGEKYLFREPVSKGETKSHSASSHADVSSAEQLRFF